jgi:hypothetical protein
VCGEPLNKSWELWIESYELRSTWQRTCLSRMYCRGSRRQCNLCMASCWTNLRTVNWELTTHICELWSEVNMTKNLFIKDVLARRQTTV